MNKCRESFEAKYRELHPNDKCTLMANGNYSGWIKQDHWWAWQSLQAEVDQQKLLTRDSELHLDAAKEEIERLKGVVNERDKQIEEALYVLKGLKAENDLWGCDQVEVQIEILEKALRGEHE